MSIFLKIKKAIEFFVNIPLFVKSGMKHSGTVLLLSPQYLNYGDHIIARSEIEYIKKVSGKAPLDFNYTFFDLWGDKVKNNIKKEDVLWITGGGYVGDLWPKSHNTVEKIIEMFPENIIVFAPQTTFFEDVDSDGAKRFLEKVNSHGKCVFFSREENTFKLLRNMGVESVMAPDFALFSQVSDCAWSDEYIAFCIRNDIESVVSEKRRKELEMKLKKYNKPFHNILMAKQHCEIPAWSRGFFIKKKMKEYSCSSVVITDRLHSMVFCCLCGVPCVALDNKSKKISGVYEWVKELDYIEYVDSFEMVEVTVSKVIQFNNKEKNRSQFEKLQKKFYSKFDSVFKEYVK